MPAEQFDVSTENGGKRLVETLDEKWGLREDRFRWPGRLTTDQFSFSMTQERKDAFLKVFSRWNQNYEAGMSNREKLPLPAVPAAPGTGKSRFAWLAAASGRLPRQPKQDAEWLSAMDELQDNDFKKGIQNAVGVAVTFNCDADPISDEKHEYMIGVRMLYGHFCDAKEVNFVDFHRHLSKHGCHEITSTTALQIIEKDIAANHVLDGRAKRHVILVVDEPLKPVTAATQQARLTQLGALTTSVGQLITNCQHVHVLMTSLSGSDLKEATRTASGRGWNLLTPTAAFA